MTRTVETNQRIYFDLDPSGRYLITGNQSTFSLHNLLWLVQYTNRLNAQETRTVASVFGTLRKVSSHPTKAVKVFPSFHPKWSNKECTKIASMASGKMIVIRVFDISYIHGIEELKLSLFSLRLNSFIAVILGCLWLPQVPDKDT